MAAESPRGDPLLICESPMPYIVQGKQGLRWSIPFILSATLYANSGHAAGHLENIGDAPSVSTSINTQSVADRVARVEQLLESGTLLQMLDTLEKLQTEVSELRGQVELQGHNLDKMQTRQRELFADLDERLYKLETTSRTADVPNEEEGVVAFTSRERERLPENAVPLIDENPATPPVPIERVQRPDDVPVPTISTSSVRLDSGDDAKPVSTEAVPNQDRQAVTAAVTMATETPSSDVQAPSLTVPTQALSQTRPSAKNISAQTAADALTTDIITDTGLPVAEENPPNVMVVSDDRFEPDPQGTDETVVDPLQIEATYRKAFSLMRERHYARASDAFRTFTERFRDSEYADNAQYWLGESHYAMREFSEAIVEYEKLMTDYPGSAKYPHAMLKIAYSYQALNSNDEANRRLLELIEQYPGTSAARLARDRLEQNYN